MIRIFFFKLIFLVIQLPIFSQVTVGPKIGISYLPFVILHPTGEVESNSFDFVFGVSGKFQLHDDWYMNTSLTYTKRKEIIWTGQNIAPPTLEVFYKHNDINVDLSLVYHIKDLLGVGLGPSIIRKYKSGLGTRMINTGENEGQIFQNRTYFGLHSLVQIKVNRFILDFQYTRKFKPDFIDFVFVSGGQNRFDVSISMMLFGYNKK